VIKPGADDPIEYKLLAKAMWENFVDQCIFETCQLFGTEVAKIK